MSEQSDFDAVEQALKAVRLFRNFYASSDDFHARLDEVCRVLEQTGEAPEKAMRKHFAEALRKSFKGS
jgi:hypothetical protein